MQERAAELEAQVQALDEQITAKRLAVEKLEVDITSLRSSDYGERIAKDKDAVSSTEHVALDALQRERVATVETIAALRSLQVRIEAGGGAAPTSPTAHIRTIHHPEPPALPLGKLVDVWAAMSGALALLAVALLVAIRPPFWPLLIVVVLLVFGAIEATTRGRLVNYLLTMTIILAVIASVILVIEFWELILALGVAAIVVFVIVGNLRELRSG
jgi:hypothetical protein